MFFKGPITIWKGWHFQTDISNLTQRICFKIKKSPIFDATLNKLYSKDFEVAQMQK